MREKLCLSAGPQVRQKHGYLNIFWRWMTLTSSLSHFQVSGNVVRSSSRAQHGCNSKKAPTRDLAKPPHYPAGKFPFPGMNGEWGILGFILLNFIFSQVCSKCPRLSGVDAYKLKLIELVFYFCHKQTNSESMITSVYETTFLP